MSELTGFVSSEFHHLPRVAQQKRSKNSFYIQRGTRGMVIWRIRALKHWWIQHQTAHPQSLTDHLIRASHKTGLRFLDLASSVLIGWLIRCGIYTFWGWNLSLDLPKLVTLLALYQIKSVMSVKNKSCFEYFTILLFYCNSWHISEQKKLLL